MSKAKTQDITKLHGSPKQQDPGLSTHKILYIPINVTTRCKISESLHRLGIYGSAQSFGYNGLNNIFESE